MIILDTLKKIGLKKKIWSLAIIPLIIFAITSFFEFKTGYDEYSGSKIIDTNIDFLRVGHELVDSLQIERGLSSAYIEGANNLNKLQERRALSDDHVKKFLAWSKDSAILKSEMDKSSALINQLSSYRAHIDNKGALATHLNNFGTMIKSILDYYIALGHEASRLKLVGVGTLLVTLRVLEEAKEMQGKLRATMIGTIAKGKPTSLSTKTQITKLREGALTLFQANFIRLSDQSKEIASTIQEKDHWKELEKVYNMIQVSDNNDSGNYPVDTTEFFTTLSKCVSDIDSSVRREFAHLENKMHETIHHNTVQMYAIGAITIILIFLILIISFFTANYIISAITAIRNFTQKIGGNSSSERIDTTPFKDELGTLANELNKMAADIENGKILSDRLTKTITELFAPYFQIDTNFKLTFVNKKVESIANKPASELLGTYCYDIFKTGDCQTENCACYKAMQTKALIQSTTVARPNATTSIPIEYFGTPVFGANNEIIGAFEFIMDQTNLYKVAKELRDASTDMGSIASVLNQSITELNQSSSNLGHISSSTSTAIEEVTTNMTQVSEQTSKAAAEVGTIASGAEEMKASMDSVSTSINQLSDSFKEIVTNTQNATKVTDEAATQSDTIAKSMIGLNKEAENIGNFVNVITGIASQTNLLALNATIEAARAGDAGKGFAVVANEVKELSKQTTNSSDDISTKIEDIQKAAIESTKKIEAIANIMKTIQSNNQTISATVEEQSAISAEVATTVSDTVNAVGEVARSIDAIRIGIEDVARAVGEISQGLTEINRGSNEISSTSLDLNTKAKSIANEAKNISTLKTQFDKVVSSFKLLDQL